MNNIMMAIDTTGNPFNHLAAEGNIDATSDGAVQFFNLIRDWYSAMIVTGAVGLVCVFALLCIKLMFINKGGTNMEDSHCICYMLLANSFYDCMRNL